MSRLPPRAHAGACAAVALAALLAACAGPGPRVGTQAVSEIGHREILVTVPQADPAALRLLGAPNARYANRRGYGPAPAVERTLNRLAREHGLRRIDGWPIASLEVHCEVFLVAEGTRIDDLLDALNADPDVDLAQRMNAFETLASAYDDPYADLQIAVRELAIVPAHAVATGRDVTVAVIDSGVDVSHPDLRGRIGVNRDFTDRSPARGGEIHGTAIAGVIASRANNREGIVGVAPDATVAALRACWASAREDVRATCSSFSLARALEAALSLDPDIINLSLVGPDDPLLARLIDVAIDRGIAVVAAAPEEAGSRESFPASHEKVFAAATDAVLEAARSRFRVAAPGREVLTTTPNARYAFLSGNSLAAAHVSGVIALLKQAVPSVGIEELASLLGAATTRTASAATINACRALSELARLHAGAGACAEPEALSLSRSARTSR